MRSKVQSQEAYWTHRTDIDYAVQLPKRKIELMLTISEKTWSGEACPASRPVSWPVETVPEYPQASYYRARYYDSTPGRFLSEDPIGFRGGDNFYRYVYDNPVGLSDPMGLSAADVQRIKEACKRCTNGLTDAGLRMNGGSGDTTLGFVGAMIVGGINDLRSGFSQLKKQSCISQATMTKPCLEDPNPPYDGKWQFDLQPIWGGSHTVVVATDTSDPTDPLVVCDPWLNRSYTMPKPPPIRQGGGKK